MFFGFDPFCVFFKRKGEYPIYKMERNTIFNAWPFLGMRVVLNDRGTTERSNICQLRHY